MPAISKYDPQTVETALHVLAANQSNAARTSQLLAEQGIDVNERTLRYWITRHSDRYIAIQKQNAPRYEEAAAHASLAITLSASQLEQDLIEGLAEAHRNGDLTPKDMANALRNVSTTRGISTEKYLLLTGRPTQVTEHRDTDAIMRALKSLNPGLVVESTATEEPTSLPA